MEDYELYPVKAEELCRSMGISRSITMAEREKIDDSDFAWPDAPDHPKYPIDSQSHLDAAAKLIGHAPEGEQAAIKARAIKIAKKHGFTLPESWQEEKSDDTQERSEESEIHALWMPAFPVTRRDADEWIVEGTATAEVPDSFGTIFTYNASKAAFQEWHSKYANMREMHGRKAAGKGIAITYDDANKRILLRTRVSKAEPGVWTKFHEGVLNGFSVGPDKNYKMGRMTYEGKSYPAITEYHLAEVSYVDAPSCPGADARIVARADGNLSDIIDDSEPEQPLQATQEPELERRGARVSQETQGAMHKAIGATLKGAKAMMDTCGCPTCCKASSAIDPDNDGDVDWLGLDDPDNDANQMDDDMEERMQRLIAPTLERSLSPVYRRQQAFLARLAQFNTNYDAVQHSLDELQTRFSQLDEIKATLERMASAKTLDEVRADVAGVKDQVERIANTPMPGGPVLNGARNPYDKTSTYSPQASAPLDRSQIERETIQRLQEQGAFRTMEDQVAAAALLMQPVQMR